MAPGRTCRRDSQCFPFAFNPGGNCETESDYGFALVFSLTWPSWISTEYSTDLQPRCLRSWPVFCEGNSVRGEWGYERSWGGGSVSAWRLASY